MPDQTLLGFADDKQYGPCIIELARQGIDPAHAQRFIYHLRPTQHPARVFLPRHQPYARAGGVTDTCSLIIAIVVPSPTVTRSLQRSMTVLDDLVRVLALTRISDNVFQGDSQDLGWGLVFGGQVLGQALSAAAQTIPHSDDDHRQVHSLQSYFLRPGDARQPITYEVDRIRDGASFTTRRVVASQHNKAIFQCAVSFQSDEQGFEHADVIPIVAGPDGLITERASWQKHADKLPELVRVIATAERPIELRPVDPINIFAPIRAPPDHAVWLRAAGALPDDPALHRYLLAYCSDFSFLTTAMRPHGVTWVDPTLQVASIDHCMWFHRPFRIDDWLLHVMHSPSASGGRGLVHGSVFTRAGILVASTAQEGLFRPKAVRSRASKGDNTV